MVRLELFGDNLGNTEYKVTRYVNDNVKTIIRTLLDLLEDDNDFEAKDFLPRNNLRIDNQAWKEMVYDLEDVVQSEVLRDYIKPKYQYLLYIIFWWWNECTDNKDDLIPIELDKELAGEIKEKYEDIIFCCERLQADNSLKNSVEDEN